MSDLILRRQKNGDKSILVDGVTLVSLEDFEAFIAELACLAEAAWPEDDSGEGEDDD